MREISFPVYLLDEPVKDDHLESNFDRPGIFIFPHQDKWYREMGYMRWVFVNKDGEKNTSCYQLPGTVWERVSKIVCQEHATN